MTKWNKRGLIIRPDGEHSWMVSHAMLPTADWLEGDTYRIYFSGRDSANRSRIGFADIDLNQPERVVGFSAEPVLDLGELGMFDDNGVTPSWVVSDGDDRYLYYIGWNRGATVRFILYVGLAVSHDRGNTFRRVSRAPILGRTPSEPLHNTSPCVLREGEKWRMWYVSWEEWIDPDTPRYNIKYAESSDGVHWRRDGTICIDNRSREGDHALARPSVIKDGGIYKMWFSYKGDDYRIGYAESEDGIQWDRNDQRAGIDVSPPGAWDSEMIEYSHVFAHRGTKYMLYCGNQYGRDGVGLAVAE